MPVRSISAGLEVDVEVEMCVASSSLKPNPFYHRGPIRDHRYFRGREEETDQAMALLQNGQSLSVVGPTRIGKTSLLLHLCHTSTDPRLGLASEFYQFLYFNAEAWNNMPGSEIHRGLLEKTLQAIGRQPDPGLSDGGESPYQALEQAVEDAVRQGIHLIYILDEFESLASNPLLDATCFSRMRGLSMSHGVTYVTASRQPLIELAYAQGSAPTSPFFSFFAQMRLGLFERSAALSLLSDGAAAAGACFDATTLDYLLTLAGTHPLLLQIAGYHALAQGCADGSPMNQDRYQRVRRRFLSEAECEWAYFWMSLQPRDQHLLALLPVAGQSQVDGLRRLEHAGLIEWHGRPTYLSPAFAEYVARQAVPGLIQVPPITLDPVERFALLAGVRYHCRSENLPYSAAWWSTPSRY